MLLKEKIGSQLPSWRARVKTLLAEHGDVKVGDVTIQQVYGGMRDVKSLVTDISYVDPEDGIRLRGYTISELLNKLPRFENTEMPLVGGLYYLLMVGEIPTMAEALEVEREWKTRGDIPGYVIDVLRSMPVNAQPMTLFSQAILALQSDSIFIRQYDAGIRKEDYWQPILEDSLNLTAKLPTIAAMIYSLKFNKGKMPASFTDLDWSGNFSHMMGIQEDGYKDLARLYFIIHSDHESGNVSAHATHMVGSTLSDIYYATSAGMNGLAGPLHGRANQESLSWLLDTYQHFGEKVPSKAELHQYAWDMLKTGRVIPGYGHAVLRMTDPRFTVQLEFGKKYFPEDPIFKLATLVYEVVPDVLREQGKARDPWPNVDAISGALQQHYGIQDGNENFNGFYTVLFGVSRSLGVTANAVWARALSQPIERPKSLTTTMLETIAAKTQN